MMKGIEPQDRVVTKTPLERLWDGHGRDLRLRRQRGLRIEDLKTLLREGCRSLVVAEPGLPLRWVPEGDAIGFWKETVSVRLADPDGPIYIDEFPGGYCYQAEEWKGPDGHVIVLLTMH